MANDTNLSARIEGTLTLKDDPVVGIDVTLTGESHVEAKTNEFGRFEATVHPGEYLVTVDEFDIEQPLQIGQGDDREISLEVEELAESLKPVPMQNVEIDGERYKKSVQHSVNDVELLHHNPIIEFEPNTKYFLVYPVDILGDFDQLTHEPPSPNGVIMGWTGDKWETPDMDDQVTSYEGVYVNLDESAKLYFEFDIE